jgi:hypothetical protein
VEWAEAHGRESRSPTASWENLWYPWRAKVIHDRIQRLGREAVRAEPVQARSGRRPVTAAKARAICDSLSEDGFWSCEPSSEQAEDPVEFADRKIVSVEVLSDKANALLRFVAGN